MEVSQVIIDEVKTARGEHSWTGKDINALRAAALHEVIHGHRALNKNVSTLGLETTDSFDSSQSSSSKSLLPAIKSEGISPNLETFRGYTNGPKRILFDYWCSNNSLEIKRYCQSKIHGVYAGAGLITVITALDEEFSGGWFNLANNVAKVSNENAPRGLGRTLYEKLDSNVTLAQGASQLAPILTTAGIFEWNGVRRGAQYRIIKTTSDWPALASLIQRLSRDGRRSQ